MDFLQLESKTIVVFGVANKKSVAYQIAKTLEEAGKIDESASIGQEALDHRMEHEGPDSWWTNRERMGQARVLQKLGQSVEAINMLEQLQQSMKNNVEPDYADTKLLEEAEALRRDLESSSS